MPSKEDGHNRGHKYPFIAGEIFNCEINQILDKFFEAPIRVKAEAAAPADDEEKEEGDKDDSDKEKSDTEKEEAPAATTVTTVDGAARDLEAEASKE